MANTLKFIDMVAREALSVAHETAQFLGTVDRQYDDSYAKSGAKIGSVLRVRSPNKYTVREGSRVMDVQDQNEAVQTITMATQSGGDAAPWPGWRTGVAAGLGILLALYVFMADALLVAHQGAEAWRRVLPEHFNWPLFLVALALMAAPVTEMARQLRSGRAGRTVGFGDLGEAA